LTIQHIRYTIKYYGIYFQVTCRT